MKSFMGRKRVIKIPKSVTIKCPKCSANSRLTVDKDRSPQFFECKKCKVMINTPVSKCCIICSYSNKKCPPSLTLEAYSKKLMIKNP